MRKRRFTEEQIVQVLRAATGAQWLQPDPVPLEDFRWTDIRAGGSGNLGQALTVLAERLAVSAMPERALPPVLVLISDGRPTDDYERGLNALLGEEWGRRAIRIEIAIGDDADREMPQAFVGQPDVKPLAMTELNTLASRSQELFAMQPPEEKRKLLDFALSNCS